MSETTRNRFVLLDGVASWRAELLQRIAVTGAERDLQLESIPGPLQAFPVEVDVKCSGAVAFACDAMYVADRATGLVFRDEQAMQLGGKGDGARHIQDPRGLAVLRDGSIVVSDPARHRVQIFSPFPHALLELWEMETPWGIAVGACEVIHVADRDAALVHRRRRDGSDLGAWGKGVLRAPTEIDVAANDVVAAIDGERMVLLDGKTSNAIDVPMATSVAFDDELGVYVGTADGLIFKFLPGAKALEYRQVGVAVGGIDDGAIAHLRFTKKHGLVAIVRDVDGSRVWRADARGAFVGDGTYVTHVIDSDLESCEWHRVAISGDIPAGSSVEVSAVTSNHREDLDADTHERLEALFTRHTSHLLGGQTRDCLLLETRGQFVRLRLRLRSAATTSPRIHAIRVYFPRESYLQYLPAVYQEDPESRDFLARFLSIFQTSFDALDARINELWRLFDPMSVPAPYLRWLAGWLALPVSPDWDEAKTREVLERAFADSRRRGTPAGLERSIADYAGVEANVVEHFRVRRWVQLGIDTQLNLEGTTGGARLWSRGYYDSMQLESWSRIGYFHLTGSPEPGIEPAAWGANEFSVFYVTSPYSAGDDARKVARIVERDKPAHTRASLCAVLPRFRVGVQATVGVDTVLSDVSPMLLGSRDAGGICNTLGHDSILGCSSAEHSARAAGGTLQPRTGVSTRLI